MILNGAVLDLAAGKGDLLAAAALRHTGSFWKFFKGNRQARIFATVMEPELLSIAGTYRTTDTPLPANVRGKPAQIRLEGERLVFDPIPL